jgi:hypothetical protein
VGAAVRRQRRGRKDGRGKRGGVAGWEGRDAPALLCAAQCACVFVWGRRLAAALTGFDEG